MMNSKIQSVVERSFALGTLFILISTLMVGFYFNRYDGREKQVENLNRIHVLISQLIVPSLSISDMSEIRHLLYMISSKDETYLVVDGNNIVIMPDYSVTEFNDWAREYALKKCTTMGIVHQKINGIDYLIDCSVLGKAEEYPNTLASGVLLSFTRVTPFSFSSLVLSLVGILFFLNLIMIIYFRKLLYHRLVKPLVILKDRVLSISFKGDENAAIISDVENAPFEVVEIQKAFKGLLDQLLIEYRGNLESEKKHALIELAAGVAHDIRSPVVALDMMIKDVTNIDEAQRLIMRNAANRIKDIANNLLSQYRKGNNDKRDSSDIQFEPEMVFELISRILSEKRSRYKSSNVSFSFNFDENICGGFATIEVSMFNRVLSNIIDNAIEAGSTKITITISDTLSSVGGIHIDLIDNGKGIPETILSQINNGVQVTSKTNGHGLGLLQAKRTVEVDWKGLFEITSTESLGTKISLVLPKAKEPNWFLPEMNISTNSTIVVLDDDESIHHVWKERLKNYFPNVKVVDFFNPEEFLFFNESNKIDNVIYLIDYEYVGVSLTGLDVIEKAGIGLSSYLVTSRHEDVDIRARVNRMGIKIIPKNFAAYISIRESKMLEASIVDLVLIDDDIGITSAWKLRSALRGKKIDTFNAWSDFYIVMKQYSMDTPIYIDSELQDSVKGEICAKTLFELGYKHVSLATGHPPEKFDNMPWLENIVGKEPPF